MLDEKLVGTNSESGSNGINDGSSKITSNEDSSLSTSDEYELKTVLC